MKTRHIILVAIIVGIVLFSMYSPGLVQGDTISKDIDLNKDSKSDGSVFATAVFYDKNGNPVSTEQLAFYKDDVEVSKISFTIGFEVSGTNINETTISVESDYVITETLMDTQITDTVFRSVGKKTDSTVFVLDLYSHFERFLSSPESSTTQTFEIKVSIRFVVTAESTYGQYMTASDSLSGSITLKWNADTISIEGSWSTT